MFKTLRLRLVEHRMPDTAEVVDYSVEYSDVGGWFPIRAKAESCRWDYDEVIKGDLDQVLAEASYFVRDCMIERIEELRKSAKPFPVKTAAIDLDDLSNQNLTQSGIEDELRKALGLKLSHELAGEAHD